MTNDSFSFDVFLSHSSKDKDIVLPIAERLQRDGLRVWIDSWEIKPGDSIPAKIEEGLEHSRVLVLCMSKNAFSADWPQLEAGTFRFRDPLNKERRFIPLRLDDALIKGSVAQFLYISWFAEDREQAYTRLFEACRQPTSPPVAKKQVIGEQSSERALKLACTLPIWNFAFAPNGKHVLTSDQDGFVRLWDMETGESLRTLAGHQAPVVSIAWTIDGHHTVSGSLDGTVRTWDLTTGRRLRVLRHSKDIWSVALSPDRLFVLSGDRRGTLCLWDLNSKKRPRRLEGHIGPVWCLAWSSDQRFVLSGGADKTIRIWDAETFRCISVLEGHVGWIKSMALSADRSLLLNGSGDKTVRVWKVKTGQCLRVLDGHSSNVNSVAWSADNRYALSGGADRAVRLWEVETGRCLRLLKGHSASVINVSWSLDQTLAFSGDFTGRVRVWDLSQPIKGRVARKERTPVVSRALHQVQYTNAKVLLVGDSGAGKTGLSKVLAGEKWSPSDSTIGAWATQWKIPVSSVDGIDREIWLWDFGGQADQRLIHQLFMEDAALAVLVFDGQKEHTFESLAQWDVDLSRASKKQFTKILAAGRVDAGGLRVSRNQIEAFVRERRFACFLETSAKADIGCEKLKHAILSGIRWADIPWRSSPLLFKRLKEEIIRLKDEGRVLMRFNELRDALRLRLSREDEQFKDEELKAVVSLLAGPGLVWELTFGNWVLLQPERINAYAQAVIRTLRDDEYECGAISEEKVLRGQLAYHSSLDRLNPEEERFVLLAMHQTLVERALCLREHTEDGPLLIFPSYYRRERPELVGHPAVLVSYQMTGFLDEIYATLVVRLHHTQSFRQDEMWRYAVDFKTLTGKKLGIKLTRRAEGSGELEVYFDPTIPLEEKIIFVRYVHEHVFQKGKTVLRLRHYVCFNCGTSVGNREVAMERLEQWLKTTRKGQTGKGTRIGVNKGEMPTIICVKCEKRVSLWDELEECFASAEVQQRVKELQKHSSTMLDNESKERALVGEVISTVALAGQISREFNVSDHGIDMEIEFKDDEGRATGKKLYLQLKSGDSHLRERKSDGAELFEIKNERHGSYWKSQAFPVMLVIRSSDGEIRWMEVQEGLKWAEAKGQEPLKQIVFYGERFDVMSVRQWRDRLFRSGS